MGFIFNDLNESVLVYYFLFHVIKFGDFILLEDRSSFYPLQYSFLASVSSLNVLFSFGV